MAMFYVAMANRDWAIKIRAFVLVVPFCIIAFMFATAANGYVTGSDSALSLDLLSYICCFAPQAQVWIGLFKVLYRYPHYNALA